MEHWSSAGRWWRTLRAVAVALALLGGAGCLTFEKETMVFVFPPGGQEVRGLLVYEGMAPSAAKAADLERAKDELGEIYASRERFYLGAWPLLVSLKPGANDDPGTREGKALFRKHLVVRSGGLFLNENGRLCGYQVVTIRDRTKFVPALNGLIGRSMAEYAERALADPRRRADWLDEGSLRLMRRASQKRFEWVQIEPGRFGLTLPATPAAAARLKRAFLGTEELARLRDAASVRLGKKGTDAPPRAPKLEEVRAAVRAYGADRQALIDYLAALPLSFEQRKDRFTVSLGLGEGEPIRLATPTEVGPAPVPGEADLIAHARKLKVPFQAGLTTEKVIADFLKEAAGKRP
jgi:hypothetical protein